MIHDLTFPSSCDQVSKTLEEKRGKKKLEKRSLLCHTQLHVRQKVAVMTLTLISPQPGGVLVGAEVPMGIPELHIRPMGGHFREADSSVI